MELRIKRLNILVSFFKEPRLWTWSWHKIKTKFEAYQADKDENGYPDADGRLIGGFVCHTGPLSIYFHYPFSER